MLSARLSVCVLLLAAFACSSDDTPPGGPGDGDGDAGAFPDAGDGDGQGDGDGGDGLGDGDGDGDGDEDAGPAGCGDDLLASDEQCDDGNTASGDGCSVRCAIEPGYACPIVGALCRAAACGDGIVAADEECEDGGNMAGDGCDERCRREDGYACDTVGSPCTPTVCGDGNIEGSEQCDDGPSDEPFDGCYQCVREPTCDDSGCAAVCGDGIKFPGEACDDGNTRANDGCSPTCTLEEGFQCSEATEEPPSSVALPIIYRDFRGKDLAEVPAAGIAAGHIDFENKNGTEKGLVKERLDADKKPEFAKVDGMSSTVATGAMFAKWYRNDPAYNRTVVDPLPFTRNEEGSYVFENNEFFPLDTRGFVGEGHEILRGAHDDVQRNFNFTSELRTQFEYKGGEFLEFVGDDDVWVFVNNRLAVDLGGVHGAQTGSVTLDMSGTDDRFGITAGNIYEIVVFQAERHTSRSQYKLTLRDFVRARTSCESICGDGNLTPNEACDDGVEGNTGGYGECTDLCEFGPRCGDGVVQRDAGEECDDQNRENGDACTNACKNGLPD